MEERELKRKEDADNAKAKLGDIRQLVSETLCKITKIKCDYDEAKSEHNKKMKNLQTIESAQQLKIWKLNSDLKNSEQVLQARLQEESDLSRANAETKEEIKKVREANDAMASEFQTKLQRLEDEINRSYAQLQSDKDAEALAELGVDSLKTEDRPPVHGEVPGANETTTEGERNDANSL